MKSLNLRSVTMYHRSKSTKTLIGLFIFLGSFVGCSRTDKPMLRVLVFRDRHSAALKSLLPEFEKKEAIKVKFDEIPAESVATKMMTDLAAGGTYDVYAMDEPFLPQFSSYLLPVSHWEDSENGLGSADSLASEKHENNKNDSKKNESKNRISDEILASDSFEPKALEASRTDGKLMGFPVNGNVYQYIFRKDLLESPEEKAKFLSQFGRPLVPARSFADVLELAQFFYRPPSLYGFAPFTKMSEGTTVELLWLLAGFGITPSQADPQLSQIEKALSFYLKLLSFSPKAAKSWHHTERMTAYAKGKIAQMMTWNSFFQDLEDDNKSLVVSRTGFSNSPEGFKLEELPASHWMVQKTIAKNRDLLADGLSSLALKPEFFLAKKEELAKKISPLTGPHPENPSSPTSLAGNWIAGVRKGTQHVKASAAFIRWWTSRSVNERLIAKGLSTARKDLLTDPALATSYPWFATTHLNFERSFLRPRHRDYKLVSHKLSKAFTRLIASQTDLKTASLEIKEAMMDMNKLASSKNSLGEVR